jgi:long-subunit fatty acid transport protein
VGSNVSGPTDADGASSFWNPAAMLRGRGTRIDAGSGVSLVRLRYDADEGGSVKSFVPKPEPTIGAYTDALGRDWRVGFTVGTPQMDGVKWSRDSGAADVTRYYAVSGRTYHVLMTPSVAYQPLSWLAVGAGVNVAHSRMSASFDKDMGKQLNLALGSSDPDAPFPYAEPMLAAPAELATSGWGAGVVGGVLATPTDRIAVGLSVHSPLTSHASGSVAVEYPQAMRDFVADAAPAAQLPELAGSVETDLSIPLMVFTAVAVRPADAWEVRADYRYVDRSSMANSDLAVVEATSPDVRGTPIVRGYNDRHSIGLRGSRELRDRRLRLALRLRYENTTVPEQTFTPSNVDFAKYELGAIASFSLTSRYLLTGQYSKYLIPSRHIDDSLHRPLAQSSLDAYNHPSPTGRYQATSDYLLLQLSAFF